MGSPPNNLQGMVVLRGGVAAGFSGKELMFSDLTIYTPGQQPTGWRWSLTFSRWQFELA
ncbi:hypothetical protein [Endozoicomonas acroporae]|uniref:hypothetical protein n=1 Tax=Endozoicomonas acroporae TaxID=1701104 RepID=UPI0015E0AF64|nr:hypothetical protein [Endozoicomonas acroporae]